MTSSVIINFGSNASALFKDMYKVKTEMKAVQAQGIATTKAVTSSAAGGPGMFKRGLSDIRFGMGIITGFLGVNLFREFFNPIKEGFLEITSKSYEFTRSMGLIRDGLVDFGREIGRLSIPLGNLMTDTVAWIVRLTQGKVAEGFFRAGIADRGTDLALAGPAVFPDMQDFQESKAINDKHRAKALQISKAQLAYMKEMTTTLGRMENDLERVNMIDPW